MRSPQSKIAEARAATAAAVDVFSCDCRGVGTDWEVAELRRISSALLGTVDIVPDPAGLAADFAAMMERPWASRSPTCRCGRGHRSTRPSGS
jgi:hypothetical protein